MRAALLTAWRKPLDLADLPEPVCPVDGVVLRVLACGVCRSDWHAWTGSDPDVLLPHIPGHEYCGIVEDVGAAVTRWQKGDRVIAPFILACGQCPACAAGNQTTCATQMIPGFTQSGAFAERIAVPRADHNLTRLPEAMDPALAAALGCRVTTAWHGLTGRAALQPGEWLAIFGTGGIGLSALLLAKAIGARVVVVDVVDEKLAHARAHGADATVNAATEDAPAVIRDLTEGGAHVAIEALRNRGNHGQRAEIPSEVGAYGADRHARWQTYADALADGCGLFRPIGHLRHPWHALLALSKPAEPD